MADIFSAIDLSTAAGSIGGILVIGIGIAMAFKAGVLGKRAVKSA